MAGRPAGRSRCHGALKACTDMDLRPPRCARSLPSKPAEDCSKKDEIGLVGVVRMKVVPSPSGIHVAHVSSVWMGPARLEFFTSYRQRNMP